MLGDDGRFHLFRDDVVLCTEMSYSEQAFAALGRISRTGSTLDDAARRACGKELLARINQLQERFVAEDRDRHGGRIPHERRCSWWTDGTMYRMFAPKTASLDRQLAPHAERWVRWTVGLLADPVDPGTVAPSRRCTFVGGRSIWPPYCGDDRLSRIRRQLTDHAGPMCHACGQTIGIVVDHDHFTGYVRGLVCWNCNAWLDLCPHLDGCPWADYLNSPPAAQLRLRYPGAHRDRGRHQARIDYLGIDPLPQTRSWTRRS